LVPTATMVLRIFDFGSLPCRHPRPVLRISHSGSLTRQAPPPGPSRKGTMKLPLKPDGQWLWTVSKYSQDEMKHPLNSSRRPSVSSSLCPSVRSSMQIDTLEAPRLPVAHHPSTESDTAIFCPPRMGRKLTSNGSSSIRPVIRAVIHPNRTNIYV
jgi:hypothetical protein